MIIKIPTTTRITHEVPHGLLTSFSRGLITAFKALPGCILTILEQELSETLCRRSIDTKYFYYLQGVHKFVDILTTPFSQA